MKSFERPQLALFNGKTGVLLSQLTVQDILLLKSAMGEKETAALFIYLPELRKWQAFKDHPLFSDQSFVFDRGLKSPAIGKGSPQPSDKKPPAQKTETPIPVATTPPRPSSPQLSKSESPHSGKVESSIQVIGKPSSPPPAIDEKTDIIHDEKTESITAPIEQLTPPLSSAPPSSSLAPQFTPLSTGPRTSQDPGDLQNPFGDLKRAFNREKLNPDAAMLDKNPLVPLTGKKPKSLFEQKMKIPTDWTDISSRKIAFEPIQHVGFRSFVKKVSFPFLMMDQTWELPPDIRFVVRVNYGKQNYQLDVFIPKEAAEKNILYVTDSQDIRYFKDLLLVLGIRT